MSDDDHRADPSPFKYHLELTPAQLKMTHTALRSLLDDFGHEEADVQSVIREVLEKLPDEHAIRAIRLDDELDRKLARKDPADDSPDTEPPDSVA
jgi:hypothetical protein